MGTVAIIRLDPSGRTSNMVTVVQGAQGAGQTVTLNTGRTVFNMVMKGLNETMARLGVKTIQQLIAAQGRMATQKQVIRILTNLILRTPKLARLPMLRQLQAIADGMASSDELGPLIRIAINLIREAIKDGLL